MDEGIDDREDERPEHGDPEPVHLETLDHSAQNPEEETVDNEGEDAERQEIERQRKQYQDRLDSDIDHAPQKRQKQRRTEALHADTLYDVRQREKRERTDQPFQQNHNFAISNYQVPISILVYHSKSLFKI